MTESTNEDQHKEVFRKLVETQDRGVSVEDSRAHIAAEFELTQIEVVRIERAGIAAQWPPL